MVGNPAALCSATAQSRAWVSTSRDIAGTLKPGERLLRQRCVEIRRDGESPGQRRKPPALALFAVWRQPCHRVSGFGDDHLFTLADLLNQPGGSGPGLIYVIVGEITSGATKGRIAKNMSEPECPKMQSAFWLPMQRPFPLPLAKTGLKSVTRWIWEWNGRRWHWTFSGCQLSRTEARESSCNLARMRSKP